MFQSQTWRASWNTVYGEHEQEEVACQSLHLEKLHTLLHQAGIVQSKTVERS